MVLKDLKDISTKMLKYVPRHCSCWILQLPRPTDFQWGHWAQRPQMPRDVLQLEMYWNVMKIQIVSSQKRRIENHESWICFYWIFVIKRGTKQSKFWWCLSKNLRVHSTVWNVHWNEIDLASTHHTSNHLEAAAWCHPSRWIDRSEIGSSEVQTPISPSPSSSSQSKVCAFQAKHFRMTRHEAVHVSLTSKLKMCVWMYEYIDCMFFWHTPPKINMEPENTPLEKENHLPNHHFQVLC